MKDLVCTIIVAIWPIISFILFFLGLFMFKAKCNSFEILYFEVVVLSTLGYGDITFADKFDRAIIIIFIILSVAHIPAALS